MEYFQFSEVDGNPDWTPGNQSFDKVWDNADELLKYHKGKGFKIREKPGDFGPMRRLSEIHDIIAPRIESEALETVFEVQSQLDSYGILLRRHKVIVDKGAMVLEHAKSLIGTPYTLGVTDCSWLTMHCYAQEGVDLPHNAHLQHLDPQVIPIKRGQIKPGDLLFHHNDAHVSLYLDDFSYGRVIDAEPHDAAAPWGGMLGTGVRVRPMNPNYYCEWLEVDGIGRVVAINGSP